MPFKIIRNDITKVQVDAIVNASNQFLKAGGGVSGAIFAAAGADNLQKECNCIGGCNTGEAVITKGYELPAKFIIHTVGPIWSGGENNEEKLLYKCYYNSLKLAYKHKCESIAFPLISSGIFNYPKDRALDTAISAISDFLEKYEMMIFLVVFDKKSYEISKNRFSDVKKFIDDNYVAMYQDSIVRNQDACDCVQFESICYEKKFEKRNLNNVLAHLDETFSQRLTRIIYDRNKIDSEVYRKANIDRKHFSKIKNNKDYHPSKTTALAFSISLELNIDETLDLLETAGYTLSNSSMFDVIVKYFINEKIYNIHEINEVLFEFDQMLICV